MPPKQPRPARSGPSPSALSSWTRGQDGCSCSSARMGAGSGVHHVHGRYIHGATLSFFPTTPNLPYRSSFPDRRFPQTEAAHFISSYKQQQLPAAYRAFLLLLTCGVSITVSASASTSTRERPTSRPIVKFISIASSSSPARTHTPTYNTPVPTSVIHARIVPVVIIPGLDFIWPASLASQSSIRRAVSVRPSD